MFSFCCVSVVFSPPITHSTRCPWSAPTTVCLPLCPQPCLCPMPSCHVSCHVPCHHVMSHAIMSCPMSHVMSHVMSHAMSHAMSHDPCHHVMSHVMSHDPCLMSCHVMSCHVMSCHTLIPGSAPLSRSSGERHAPRGHARARGCLGCAAARCLTLALALAL